MLCYFQRISSTQDELLKLLESHHTLPDGNGLAAAVQTHGHGRGNKIWHAREGQNALFSFVHRPAVTTNDAYLLNQAAAAAVALSLQAQNIPVAIKWPNDLLADGRKIAGVLVNTRIEQNNVRLAVVGIGLNVNQTDFPTGLNATSIKALTGHQTDPLDWPHRIIRHYFALWAQGPVAIRQTYFDFWSFKGPKNRIITRNGHQYSGWVLADIRNGKIHIFRQRNTKPFIVPLEEIKHID